MYDINKCHPIDLDDLVRLGRNCDGGYILSKRQIDSTKILLSFGLSDDWSFEKDFAKINNVKTYSYDHSIKDRAFVNKKFTKIFLKMMYNLFLLKRARVKRYFNEFSLSKDFYLFFDNKEHFFIPKFIGQYDDDKNICFQTIFEEIGNVEEHSVFIKWI